MQNSEFIDLLPVKAYPLIPHRKVDQQMGLVSNIIKMTWL